jgi:hypothetical protein
MNRRAQLRAIGRRTATDRRLFPLQEKNLFLIRLGISRFASPLAA